MRKQNRPNQTARKQMQNLTVELFARDMNARRQLLDEALAVSPTNLPGGAPGATLNDSAPSSSKSSSSEKSPVVESTSEPIQELVQVLLAPEPIDPIPRKPRSPRKSLSSKPKSAESLCDDDQKSQEEGKTEESKPVAAAVVEEKVPEPQEESMPRVVVVEQVEQEDEISEPPENKPFCSEPIEPTTTRPTTPIHVEHDEPFITPPPLQRVPYEAQPSHLANIRAVAESMNIAAIPSSSSSPLQQQQQHQQQQQQPASLPNEPMSFAACVRKPPSIESMSIAPSPYSRFDGKTSPFGTGGNGNGSMGGFSNPGGQGGFGNNQGGQGGFSNPGGFGGFSREPNKNPNPFANRKKFNYEHDSSPQTPHSHPTSRFFPDRSDPVRDLTDSFSSLQSKPNGFINRGIPRESASSGLLPNWYKGRSFSTASSHYPYSQRSTSSGHFSSFAKPSHSTSLNIPSHGHVEDLDGFLAATPQPNPFFAKRSDLNMKKERWARMKAKKRMLRRPIEDEFYEDLDVEEEILRGRGVMLNQIVQQGPTGNYEDADLLRKYRRDVAYVKERVLSTIDGNIDGIRDLRFLLASVQTYGNIDGECMLAELGLNEFSLFSGIIEKFHAIVGPWQTDNESHKRRASRHAFETHRIPLQHSFATVTKRKLVEEILGRVEPSIACHQGVKVGLYSDSCNEKTRIELNIKNNFKDPGMICDKNDRRFILVLQSELDLMVESMKHLAKTVGFHYDGFPVHHNNFVIVEAFVEAISDIMNEKVDMETMRWFSLLGQKVETEENVSPWDTGADYHCSRHSEPKSNFCAALTVGRTCCIIYHVLGSFFRRYHLKKIPTANHIPSTSSSIH